MDRAVWRGGTSEGVLQQLGQGAVSDRHVLLLVGDGRDAAPKRTERFIDGLRLLELLPRHLQKRAKMMTVDRWG